VGDAASWGGGGSEQAERWETDCETGPSVPYFLVVDASPRAMAGIGKGSSLPSVDSAETNGTGSALETEGRRGGLLAMLERKARRNEKKQR
jgi:hypothetical protein